ncbi:MAG: hypothetical protein ABI624_05130 [Casimicrobiaceae bacterium]
MDAGIAYPIIGVVIALIVVYALRRIMRRRPAKAPAAEPAPAEAEAEFLDSSHIISGPIIGAAESGWKAGDAAGKKRP